MAVKTRIIKTAKGKTLADKRSARLAQTMKHITDTKTEGVGKYVNSKEHTFSRTLSGRSVKGLTRGQTYRLEKRALKNEALKINAKPEMIKAIGSAFAQNLAGPGTGAGLALGSKFASDKKDNNSSNVSNLIGGGANQAGTNNEEEQQSLEEQYQIR